MSSTHEPPGLTDAQRAFRQSFEAIPHSPPEVARYRWMVRNPATASTLLELLVHDKAEPESFGKMIDKIIGSELAALRKATKAGH